VSTKGETMKIGSLIVATVVMAAAFPIAAPASVNLYVPPLDASGHPVFTHPQGTPIAWNCGIGLIDSEAGNPDYTVQTLLSFRNTDPRQRTITAVEFHIVLQDAFGATLGIVRVQAIGSFAYGLDATRVDNQPDPKTFSYSTINIWPGAQQAKCIASKVRFADGTIWRAK
jgi:hypothetical protein